MLLRETHVEITEEKQVLEAQKLVFSQQELRERGYFFWEEIKNN